VKWAIWGIFAFMASWVVKGDCSLLYTNSAKSETLKGYRSGNDGLYMPWMCRGQTTERNKFSIAKIKFLWRVRKFKWGHGCPFLLPMVLTKKPPVA